MLVFDRNMKYLGYVELGSEVIRRITRGFAGNEIFVAMDEPYPRIVRYIVEKKSK